jgi:hypothetical protein
MALIERLLGTIASAKSSESFDSNSEEIEYVEHPLAPEPRIHPVQVTVIKDGNGLRFLANLLFNLTFSRVGNCVT